MMLTHHKEKKAMTGTSDGPVCFRVFCLIGSGRVFLYALPFAMFWDVLQHDIITNIPL